MMDKKAYQTPFFEYVCARIEREHKEWSEFLEDDNSGGKKQGAYKIPLPTDPDHCLSVLVNTFWIDMRHSADGWTAGPRGREGKTNCEQEFSDVYDRAFNTYVNPVLKNEFVATGDLVSIDWKLLCEKDFDELQKMRCFSCGRGVKAWYGWSCRGALNADCKGSHCWSIRMDGFPLPPWAEPDADTTIDTESGERTVYVAPPEPTLEEIDAERGVMQATTNAHGWVRCPHCETRFRKHVTTSWDGERHRSCGTRLEIIAYSDPDMEDPGT